MTGRATILKFDDYCSPLFQIKSGIDLGCPLSVLAFLFYNTDVLDIADRNNGELPSCVPVSWKDLSSSNFSCVPQTQPMLDLHPWNLLQTSWPFLWSTMTMQTSSDRKSVV